jgi:hypothetical protein
MIINNNLNNQNKIKPIKIFSKTKNNLIHLIKNRMLMKIQKTYLNSFKKAIKKDKIII